MNQYSGTTADDKMAASKLRIDHAHESRQLREIQSQFASSPYRQIRGVQAALFGDSILLTGQVSTFSFKQIAQEIAKRFATDLNIDNQIAVVDDNLPSRCDG